MTKTTITTTTTINNNAVSGTRWTLEEDQVIKNVIAKKGTLADAAKKLNRTEKAISLRFYILRNKSKAKNFNFTPKSRAKRKVTAKRKTSKTVPARHTAKTENLRYTIPITHQAGPSTWSVNTAAYALTAASVAVILSLVL